MRARRAVVVLAVLAVAGVLLLVAEPVAHAKEGVTARLLAPLPLDAGPGEKVTVVWALGGPDEQGRRRPFNAIGVFVRLLSATGGRSTVGFATPDAHPQGRYEARVAVPEGGIGGVQVGLRGTSDGAAADTLFPLENDPFAAPARGQSAGQGATGGRHAAGGRRPTSGWPVPAWLAGAVALLGVAGTVAWRARRRAAAG
jgi:hypothetical protein